MTVWSERFILSTLVFKLNMGEIVHLWIFGFTNLSVFVFGVTGCIWSVFQISLEVWWILRISLWTFPVRCCNKAKFWKLSGRIWSKSAWNSSLNWQKIRRTTRSFMSSSLKILSLEYMKILKIGRSFQSCWGTILLLLVMRWFLSRTIAQEWRKTRNTSITSQVTDRQ